MNLTDEEIRIKVAEAMDLFRIKPLRRTTRKGNDDPNGVKLWYCSEHHGGAATYDELPNYPEDLNACAEFETELKKLGVFSAYLSNLALVCGFNAQGNEAWFQLHAGLEAVCSATARQRCIAYLKVKGILP